MTERGESSRIREDDAREIAVDIITEAYATIPGYEMPPILVDEAPEEEQGEYREIQIDTVQPREMELQVEAEAREDQADMPVDSDPDEEYRGRSSTPVRGGVMRLGGYTDEEEEPVEDDSDSEPEEDSVHETEAETHSLEAPEPASPVFYQPVDGMGSTADDIIEGMTELQEQLEARVHHLEVQNQVHQDMEHQYRDVAYQRLSECTELQRERGELIRQLEQQVARADQLQTERDAARAELQTVRGELTVETVMREFAQEAWIRATDRVTELEEQVRDGGARTDTALFAFDTAMGRLRSRIRRFPREEDMSRRAIDRRVVDHMIYQEHRDAIRRVTRD